ncbi:MFS transporter [Vulcanisaeta distributa]|uniref:Major facilitator superfamily MFS_1 n=1 Tax=Vulcanisaeta distributa (strain DSM 14429 / JCM 11212 / NBRC 100878 / IC-017) TaxID=572478 RepID=E1QSK5_VULDI|nr:MFS transporter [Vulcanisaeta distributa]ADN50798.1 major facilitator superfamily MFS_1 [Vulcanisaeta distributa DSM 14429]
MQRELWVSISESQRRAVLINAFLGALLGSMNISSVVIALPAILRGIGLSINSSIGFMIMAWIMFAYPLIMAITVALIGRLSDMYGRGRVFTIGDIVFTTASLLLGLTPGYGAIAGIQMVIYRFVQGLGGSMMFSNSAAIITDVFPPERRGVAQGVVGISFSAGSILGLVIGGLLATINWRWVFLFNVPVGVASIIWAYRSVYKLPAGFAKAKIDWIGASLLTTSLVLLLMGLMLSMMPYGGSSLGWGNPMVWVLLGVGGALFALLFFIESRIPEPMLRVKLFRIRQFTYGVVSSLFLFLAQGANVFVLSLLLQAIYLPLHGVPYADTPLWAGIYLIPSSITNAIFAPIGGKLLNRFGARVVSTLGAILLAASFELLTLLPITNFNYIWFAAILLLMGAGSGLFQSPNLVSILSAVPPTERSAASGLRASMQNIGLLMSFAIFLTLILTGASTVLTQSIYKALLSAGVPMLDAEKLVSIPPVYALFAAFLGYDPIKTLVEQAGILLPANVFSNIDKLTFFPSAIAPAMAVGFYYAYHTAAILAILAAVFSYLRGREAFHHTIETVQAGARSTAKVIEQTNTPDPIGNKVTNGVNGNIDIKSDPILRKTYAAYLLMNTELSDTVLNSITGKELVYAIAITSGLPDWFVNFVNSINDCQFTNSTIETLTKYVSVPDWLSEVVNAWLKIKSSNS